MELKWLLGPRTHELPPQPTQNYPCIIWLVVWNIFYFSIDWECHHPNWRTHIFRGVGRPPTSIPMNFQRKVVNVPTCWRLGTTHVCRSPKRQAGHFLHLTWSTWTRSHGLSRGIKLLKIRLKSCPNLGDLNFSIPLAYVLRLGQHRKEFNCRSFATVIPFAASRAFRSSATDRPTF